MLILWAEHPVAPCVSPCRRLQRQPEANKTHPLLVAQEQVLAWHSCGNYPILYVRPGPP